MIREVIWLTKNKTGIGSKSEGEEDLLILTKSSTLDKPFRELLTIDLFYHTKGNEYTRVNLKLEGRKIDQLRNVLLGEMPEKTAKEIANWLSAELIPDNIKD